MMIPERPVVGEEIPDGYFGRLWDFVRSLQLKGDNKTVRVHQNYDGTNIEVVKDKPVSAGFADSEEGGGGEKAFAILTSVPALGYGQGIAIEANITATGEIVTVGESYPVLIPKIYRDNS